MSKIFVATEVRFEIRQLYILHLSFSIARRRYSLLAAVVLFIVAVALLLWLAAVIVKAEMLPFD
jgi:hypothetical protein